MTKTTAKGLLLIGSTIQIVSAAAFVSGHCYAFAVFMGLLSIQSAILVLDI